MGYMKRILFLFFGVVLLLSCNLTSEKSAILPEPKLLSIEKLTILRDSTCDVGHIFIWFDTINSLADSINACDSIICSDLVQYSLNGSRATHLIEVNRCCDSNWTEISKAPFVLLSTATNFDSIAVSIKCLLNDSIINYDLMIDRSEIRKIDHKDICKYWE